MLGRVSLGELDDLVNGRVMEETYGKMKCPQDSSSTAFSGTCIYWRLSDGDRAIEGDHHDGKTAEDAVTDSSRGVTDDRDLAQALELVTLG